MKRPYAGTVGVLTALIPLPFAVSSWVHGVQALHTSSWVLLVATLTAVCSVGAGLTLVRHPPLGALLASLGLVGVLALLTPVLEPSPVLALAIMLVALTILHTFWRGVQYSERLRPAYQSIVVARARGAAGAALGFWGCSAVVGNREESWVVLASLAVTCGIASFFGLRWLLREGARHRGRTGVLLGAMLVAACGVAITWGWWWGGVTAAAVMPATMLITLPMRQPVRMESRDWWEPILGYPERLLVATFLALCLAGTVGLALPVSAATGSGLAVVNAAFTAVSAVCVTGLIVLDTPVDFSVVGQVVILVLIQLGGLGIMTFSTAAMHLLGRRLSLRHEGAVAGLISPQDRGQLFRATRRLMAFTFTTEAFGALGLCVAFVRQGDSLLLALWRAVFTSISAFCNAGFALQSDNLVSYQTDPWVLHLVAGLIIAGGLSPLVVLAVPDLFRRTGRPVAAQIKLALSTTLLLLMVGFIFVLAVEWGNTLGGLPFWHRLHNAWFQSATLRTAGFNSIDIAAVHPATLTLMIVWMFIGGSPGGTAGGIKTTTVATLALAVASAVRGRWTVTVFQRRLSHRTVYKATAIATGGAVTVLLSLLIMQLTQAMPAGTALFEVVSALGTVGLSIGGTNLLDEVGKMVIMACMFMGRVGPLTLFMFLSHRLQHTVWERPEEEVEVG
jgi:trk system potassium uptake protein TrkH